MKSFFAVALLVGAASAYMVDDLFRAEWHGWKLAHGKTYASPREESFRQKIFLENRMKIAEHNKMASQGEFSFTMGMNQFGDLLHSEFKQAMNGYRQDLKSPSSRGATYISPANVELPDEVDWRTKGAVTPIKDQGQCGSCWAFSAVGSLEGQHFRKTGKLVSLSEQNVVDCSRADNGCGGGLMDDAFKYIKQNGGVDTEKSYPYRGYDEICRFNKTTVGATDVGYVDVTARSEKALAEAVATVGPVSVAIDASNDKFQFYKSGIYDVKSCSNSSLDHGVLTIGYGDGYWLVKNSWGTGWGMKGYIKMTRDGSNQCGIATLASYPLV